MQAHVFDHWLKAWNLKADGRPYTSLSGSRLMAVVRQGEQGILKILGHAEERRGAALMDWYGGIGAARVWERDGDALLLERLTGDQSLVHMSRSGRDDEATLILCQAAERLHAARPDPPPSTLVPLEVWFQA